MRICKYCNREFDLPGKVFSNHVRWCDCNIEQKKIDVSEKFCGNCGVSIGRIVGRNPFCSESCKTILFQKNKELAKKKISIGRKKYLKENPDKHPWKSLNKFISKPCEYLKDRLREKNISFVCEYSPFVDLGRMYSVDIAFPNEKIGIEVNGNQHYNNDGTLKKYYQDRHDFFVDNGWKLIEIFYTTVYSIDIETIFDFDSISSDYTNYISNKLNG
jgi:very-short-patch-repair endonuclease/endogenous inhibitor of DNA gyrase (YacG/DUF329 family)